MRVKICGITNLKDAEAASKAGADYIGFIINYPNSKRSIDYKKACNIIYNVKQANRIIKIVGVFVDQSKKFIEKVGCECQLDVVQLHGKEDAKFCKKLRENYEVWKAIEITKQNDLNEIKKYRNSVDRILLDSGKGSGKLIDKKLLEKIENIDVIAGGININNINNIIKLKPVVIDINSGIERESGKKDLIKLKKIIEKIKR